MKPSICQPVEATLTPVSQLNSRTVGLALPSAGFRHVCGCGAASEVEDGPPDSFRYKCQACGRTNSRVTVEVDRRTPSCAGARSRYHLGHRILKALFSLSVEEQRERQVSFKSEVAWGSGRI